MKRNAVMNEIGKTITEARRQLIESLSDPEIVQLAACNAGIAYFPEVGKAFCSPEWGGGHWDHHVDSGWTNRYGPAVIGGRAAVIPESHRALDLESMQGLAANDSDADETEFERNMGNPAWVTEIAAAWRTEMLSSGVTRDEVEAVADRWMEVLDQLENSST
ncbi:hypothetical protein [Paraburkholderia graminis]|uniref:Uncharacterized protein n=1 Tax=Paraburkholderia graminis TaxID=60548 RepID=A0ABD5CHB8_9BURK|nr:hypothetical protein [Paraburkholderia graminis]MDR6203264.1 hypothetical protein [Paraburkholderia graminis]